MPGILDSILGIKQGEKRRAIIDKHEEDMQKQRHALDIFGRVAQDYFTNPQSPISDDQFAATLSTFKSVMPPELAKHIENQVELHKSVKALSRSKQSNGSGTNGGLPQPPSTQAGSEAPSTTPAPSILTPPPASPDQGETADSFINPAGPAPSAPPQQAPVSSPQAPVTNTPLPPALTQASQLSQSGFGITPPPPTTSPDPSVFRGDPSEYGQRMAAQTAPLLSMQTSAALAADRAKHQGNIDRLRTTPGFDQLTPREQFSAISGHSISPEPTRSMPGMTESVQGDVDYNGAPVEPGTVGRKMLIAGKPVFTPSAYKQTLKNYIDTKTGKTVTYFVDPYNHTATDQQGNPVSLEGLTPALLPQTVTGMSMETKEVADPNDPSRLVLMQVPTPRSSTVQKQLPQQISPPPGTAPGNAQNQPTARPRSSGGSQGQPVAPGSPKPASTPSATPSGAPRGAKVIGTPAGQVRRDIENPYTPAGQSVLQQTDSVLPSVERVMAQLASLKDNNTPMSMGGDKLLYSIGMSSDMSKLINELELEKITAAGSALKSAGGIRAIQALKQAQVHTADPSKDSPKLMYEKLQTIHDRLTDVNSAVDKHEKKYPGMTPPPGRTLTPPPASSTGTIRVKRKSDGATGNMNASDFDPGKYEKL